MTDKLALLAQTALFRGFAPEELAALLAALAPVEKAYLPGEALLLAGYENRDIGIVLAGEIEASKETRAGGRFTVSRMGPGGVFGDVLSGSQTRSPVTVSALTACRVLTIPYPRLFGGEVGPLRERLLANLVAVIADKYFALDRRVDLLLMHGLRRRIATYLLGEAAAAGSDTFRIPFTRTALAAYLGCERSALSREISRMAAEGLLETYRASFRLLQPEALRALV